MSSRDSYGEVLADLVDEICRFEDRSEVFRKNDISKGHYYNVINPNKTTPAGRDYHCPTEWGVRLTNSSGNYSWLKAVAKDCGCIVITPDDISELKTADPERTLAVLSRIVGMAQKKGGV